ncbi:MAG: Holliday junction resolvase RuvX [Saprospiraceae bacterium]|nr:Holliday junction resolvase RuvX [Saprospiraceae bacterium]
MAIDYGLKRTGVAVTDPLQIIASGLDMVPTSELMDFLKNYFSTELVEKVIVGEPLHKDGNPMEITQKVYGFVQQFKKLFPDKEVILQDERFTSKEASSIIMQSGLKKKKRREKGLVDKIAAALILQEYMEQNIW